MPVVVTLPLTDLSAPTVIVPVPAPALVTGGTSWAPDMFTLMSAATAMLEYGAKADIAKSNAALSGSHACLEILSRFIESSLCEVV
jgi:hypothetical protein